MQRITTLFLFLFVCFCFVCLVTVKALVFLLVSVSCDTVQILGVLAAVDVL